MTPASERFRIYLEEGRKIASAVVGLDFDNDQWQLPHNRAHLKGIKKLNWHGLPLHLATLGKAIVANESLPNGGNNSFGRSQFPVVLQFLGKVVGERDLTTITRKDFDLACQALEERTPRFSPKTLHVYGADLGRLVKVLNLRRLIAVRTDWSNPFPKSDQSERDRLIPPEVLRAFGEIRSAVLLCDDNDPDRLIVSAITLLIVSGMRIGELLTMPADCWHEGVGEDDEGRILKGVWLGYTPEKQGLNENTMPRWIPSPLISLAKESVDEIHRITAPFRENARCLHEGRVNVPVVRERLYDLREAANLLGGLSIFNASNGMRKRGLIIQKINGGKSWVSGAQIEDYVRELSSIQPLITKPFHQTLHESLFVIAHNFFMRRPGAPRPTPGTAKRLIPQHIGASLKSQGFAKSLFERFNKLDRVTGRPFAFASHDPRHTLTTWQVKNGIDPVRVAAYFGRDVNQADFANSFYTHLTLEQSMALVDRALATDHFQGGWAKEYAKVKDPVRKEEVRHRLAGNVGYSQLGICAHPEGSTPPTIPEACSRCPGLIVIPGSLAHQKRALEIQAEIEDRISVYESQASEGVFMAGKWLEVEYERQKKNRKVIEVLFSRDPLGPDDEPSLVQMGNSETKEC